MVREFCQIISDYAEEFLRSMDSVNETRKIFVRQTADFKSLCKKWPILIYPDGSRSFFPHTAYASVISSLANDERVALKDGYKYGEPSDQMKKAGFDVDDGLAIDIKEMLQEFGFLKYVDQED